MKSTKYRIVLSTLLVAFLVSFCFAFQSGTRRSETTFDAVLSKYIGQQIFFSDKTVLGTLESVHPDHIVLRLKGFGTTYIPLHAIVKVEHLDKSYVNIVLIEHSGE